MATTPSDDGDRRLFALEVTSTSLTLNLEIAIFLLARFLLNSFVTWRTCDLNSKNDFKLF